MFRKNALFAIFVFMTAALLFFSPISLAQDPQTVPQIETDQQDETTYKASAEEWVNGLAILNLTADQRTEISDILVEYQKEKHAESTPGMDTDTQTDTDTETGIDTQSETGLDLKSRINDQIDAVLTDTQRTQFETMRESWWSNIDNSIQNKDFNQGDINRDTDTDTDIDTDTDTGTDTDTTDIK